MEAVLGGGRNFRRQGSQWKVAGGHVPLASLASWQLRQVDLQPHTHPNAAPPQFPNQRSQLTTDWMNPKQKTTPPPFLALVCGCWWDKALLCISGQPWTWVFLTPLAKCVSFLLLSWFSKVSCHSSCRLQLDIENTTKGQKRTNWSWDFCLLFSSSTLTTCSNSFVFQRSVYIEGKVFSSLPSCSASSEGQNNGTGTKDKKLWSHEPKTLLRYC